jgi:hypothetical protein
MKEAGPWTRALPVWLQGWDLTLVTHSERSGHNVEAMSDRTLARLAWATYLVVSASLLVSLGFFAFFLVVDAPWDAGRTVSAVLVFVFPTVGILVARAQPRNPIGWTLLGIGLVWGLLSLADPYIWYAYVGEPGSQWRPDLVVAATSSLTRRFWISPSIRTSTSSTPRITTPLKSTPRNLVWERSAARNSAPVRSTRSKREPLRSSPVKSTMGGP